MPSKFATILSYANQWLWSHWSVLARVHAHLNAILFVLNFAWFALSFTGVWNGDGTDSLWRLNIDTVYSTRNSLMLHCATVWMVLLNHWLGTHNLLYTSLPRTFVVMPVAMALCYHLGLGLPMLTMSTSMLFTAVLTIYAMYYLLKYTDTSEQDDQSICDHINGGAQVVTQSPAFCY